MAANGNWRELQLRAGHQIVLPRGVVALRRTLTGTCASCDLPQLAALTVIWDDTTMEAREFPSDTVAPWAEVVPGAGPMTIDDLAKLRDDRWQYELVEGVLVRMPWSGGQASRIARRLAARLGDFVDDHALGDVTGADGGYAFSATTELAPDVGFMRAERVPPRTSPAFAKAWPGAPDLAVEVASPNQHRPGMRKKVQYYLNAGTRLVWVIWPRRQQVDVWRPGDTQPSATLGMGDTLTGEDVVPGFSYAVIDLFA